MNPRDIAQVMGWQDMVDEIDAEDKHFASTLRLVVCTTCLWVISVAGMLVFGSKIFFIPFIISMLGMVVAVLPEVIAEWKE